MREHLETFLARRAEAGESMPSFVVDELRGYLRCGVLAHGAVRFACSHCDEDRLVGLFAGSTEGAHRACVLLGIVATCRALGVPVQAYLAWAFDRLGTHRAQFGLGLNRSRPPPSRPRAADDRDPPVVRAERIVILAWLIGHTATSK